MTDQAVVTSGGAWFGGIPEESFEILDFEMAFHHETPFRAPTQCGST